MIRSPTFEPNYDITPSPKTVQFSLLEDLYHKRNYSIFILLLILSIKKSMEVVHLLLYMYICNIISIFF